MAHYLATGERPLLDKRIELNALRADGSQFAVELAITRIRTKAPAVRGYLRDISDRVRTKQLRSVRFAVTKR
jgi:PAS domain S-box-containing protein